MTDDSRPGSRSFARRPARVLAAGLLLTLAACGSFDMAHQAQPPSHVATPLAGARAEVYRLADDPESGSGAAPVCATNEGYCTVPAGTAPGLHCVCEAQDGSWRYAGRTGAIPAAPPE
jgi:hypothetical protein